MLKDTCPLFPFGPVFLHCISQISGFPGTCLDNPQGVAKCAMRSFEGPKTFDHFCMLVFSEKQAGIAKQTPPAFFCFCRLHFIFIKDRITSPIFLPGH